MVDALRLATAALELGVARYARLNARTAANLALVGTGAVCVVGAGGFGIAALLIYLIPILGAAEAALAVAGVLIAIAIAALLVSRHLSREPRRPAPTPELDLQSIAAQADAFVRENKALSLSAAFVAGLLAAEEIGKPR